MSVEMFGIIIQAGSFGIVAWIVYWFCTRWYPRKVEQEEKLAIQNQAAVKELQQMHQAALSQQRGDFSDLMKSVVISFREESQQDRASWELRHASIVRAVEKLTETVDAVREEITKH